MSNTATHSSFVSYQRAESIELLLNLKDVIYAIPPEEVANIYQNRKTKIPVICGVCNNQREVQASSLVVTKSSTCNKCALTRANSKKPKAQVRRIRDESTPEGLVFRDARDKEALGHCRNLVGEHVRWARLASAAFSGRSRNVA